MSPFLSVMESRECGKLLQLGSGQSPGSPKVLRYFRVRMASPDTRRLIVLEYWLGALWGNLNTLGKVSVQEVST